MLHVLGLWCLSPLWTIFQLHRPYMFEFVRNVVCISTMFQYYINVRVNARTIQNRQSRGSVNSWHKIQNGHKQDKTQQNKLDKQNGRHQRNRGHCFFILLKGSYLKCVAFVLITCVMCQELPLNLMGLSFDCFLFSVVLMGNEGFRND